MIAAYYTVDHSRGQITVVSRNDEANQYGQEYNGLCRQVVSVQVVSVQVVSVYRWSLCTGGLSTGGLCVQVISVCRWSL